MGVVPLWERLKRLLPKRSSVDKSFVYSLVADAEAGKESALPFLFPLVFDADDRVSVEVAEVVTRLTGDYSPKDWRRLDVSMRWLGGYCPPGFPKLTPASLESLDRFGNRRTILLGLASMNGNGFVRQEAVRQLSLLSDGELPFLLLRLNDWVEEVRQEALTVCAARTRPEYAARYMTALPLVLGLATAGRNDFGGFIASVEELLSQPECRPVLTQGFSADDAVIRRTAFRLALVSAGEDAMTLFGKAFLSHDPIIRWSAARLLRARPAGDAVQLAFLDRPSKDTSAVMRFEYLLLCSEKYPDRADAALRDALLDVNSSVRSVAQFYLRQGQDVDLAHFYRAAIETPTSGLAPAIAGLGETGRATDAEKIIGFLRHPSASVRRAAVTALGRLNGNAETPRLLHALGDESARVSRAAREMLEPRLNMVSDEALWETLTGAHSLHSRRNTLRLMYALPKWRGAVLLLKAGRWLHEQTADDDIDQLLALTRRWLAGFHGGGILPTWSQLASMQEYLQDAHAFLPAQVAVELGRVAQSAARLTG